MNDLTFDVLYAAETVLHAAETKAVRYWFDAVSSVQRQKFPLSERIDRCDWSLPIARPVDVNIARTLCNIYSACSSGRSGSVLEFVFAPCTSQPATLHATFSLIYVHSAWIVRAHTNTSIILMGFWVFGAFHVHAIALEYCPTAVLGCWVCEIVNCEMIRQEAATRSRTRRQRAKETRASLLCEYRWLSLIHTDRDKLEICLKCRLADCHRNIVFYFCVSLFRISSAAHSICAALAP